MTRNEMSRNEMTKTKKEKRGKGKGKKEKGEEKYYSRTDWRRAISSSQNCHWLSNASGSTSTFFDSEGGVISGVGGAGLNMSIKKIPSESDMYTIDMNQSAKVPSLY